MTITPELLDEVSIEVESRRDYHPAECAIIPVHLLRRMYGALVWGGDEVTQLREDLHGTTLAYDMERTLNGLLMAEQYSAGPRIPLTAITRSEAVPA